jgi:hypothetical protein
MQDVIYMHRSCAQNWRRVVYPWLAENLTDRIAANFQHRMTSGQLSARFFTRQWPLYHRNLSLKF